jgi:hypothetical protein
MPLSEGLAMGWDDVSYYMRRPYNWIRNAYYYGMNRWIWHGHMLRTEVEPGQYSDKVFKIPSALFCAVEDYVARDQEDAFGRVEYNTNLAPIKAQIIQILHFWCIERPELQGRIDQTLSEWAVATPMVIYPIHNGRSKLEFEPKDPAKSKELLDLLHQYEAELLAKTKKYAKKVVMIHEYLWT